MGFEIIIFLLILALLAFVHKQTKFFSLRYPTIPGFYFVFFVLMASTLLQPGEVYQYNNTPGYYNFIIAIFLHAIFFLLGILIAYSPLVNPKVIVYRVNRLKFSQIEVKVFKVFTAIAIILFFHALLTIKSIPIIQILKAGADESLAADATINKESLFKESIGINNYLWNLNRQIFFPIIIVYSFSTYFKTKKRNDLYIFSVLLVTGILNNAISGSLAPVALIFFMIGITFIYLSNRIKTKHYVLVIATSLLFPIFVDYSASNHPLIESAQITLEKTYYRFSGETFKRSLDYFNVYGVTEPFLGGRTHKIFTFFTGKEYFNVSNYIFVKNLPLRKLAYASTGHQNAHYICYMYADFGLVGVIISSLITGFFVTKIQIWSARYLDNRISFAGYIILVTLFWKLMGVNPFTILFSHGALLLIILIIYISKRKALE